jgi:tetratricopeptide (TPR) repeat protein
MKKNRFYAFITIAIFWILPYGCTSKPVQDENSAKQSGAPTAETIAKADELFKQRSDLSKLREAVNLLAQARNPDNRNYEVEWKFAEYNYFLGKQTDEKESEKALENGARAGKIASRIEPNKPDGFFWYGANLGELAERAPLTKGLTSVGDIREAMNKVIEIEPDYQGASAYDALAQIELATRMTGGKTEKAIEYLEKALQLEQDNSNIHLHLAEAYLLAANRNVEAKKQLEYIQNMKPDPDFLPEYNEDLQEAKKLLATKF